MVAPVARLPVPLGNVYYFKTKDALAEAGLAHHVRGRQLREALRPRGRKLRPMLSASPSGVWFVAPLDTAPTE